MKRVEAEISPAAVEDVKERLLLIGVSGMTVVPCSAGVRLEIVTTDEMAESVARAVMAVVRREADADGRIVVAPVDEVVRISTGEVGGEAL